MAARCPARSGPIPDAEIFIGLLVAVALLAELARRLRVPSPILLVLGGLLLGFVPGLPAPSLDPKIFFFFFLPPLVYSEAFLFSTDALKRNAAEIAFLAVGLVLITAAAVAMVAHHLVGLPWASAFVLGAVVGPTDPVAATAVIRRLGVPERVLTILEGESLANDATALVIYKLAIAAVAAGTFSLGHAVLEFFWFALGGIGVGALVAWLWMRLRRWVTESEVEITISLVMPFAAYFPAERLHVSGVLAAVTAGLLLGAQAYRMAPDARLRGHAFWDVLVFLLNSTLFLLLGLTFPDVVDRLSGTAWGELALYAVAIAATVMAIRLVWMFLLPRIVAVIRRGDAPPPPAGELVVLGWSGMRGGVSLAAALAIPVLAGGEPFPGRDEIIFLTYMVLLATLVVPGLTLGPLVRALGVGPGEGRARANAAARALILAAALEHIDELARNDELPEELAERLRLLYESRLAPFSELLEDATTDEDGLGSEESMSARRGALEAQRAMLADLQAREGIGDEAAHEIAAELDLEERSWT